MKKFAGVAQPVERRGVSHSEVARSNLAPRSIHQALAAGLKIDPAARKLGAGDGNAGMFRLSVDDILGRSDETLDVLAYLGGWLEGQQAKRRRG
jgi:hypothetical protein